MKNIFLFFVVFPFYTVFAQQDTLQTISVTGKRGKIQKSLVKATNTVVVSSQELLKAACCNLAESFETNPTIDVSFSDALTGTKQIKMLGLTSPYLLITEENIPSVRGASQAYGLTFTPGTWIESIQITKGAGSVVNGYESISGHINTELVKPNKEIPLFVNAYYSTDSRTEINTHLTQKIDSLWATSLLVHGNLRPMKKDMNNDGFLDNPIGNQINIMNRWQYNNAKTGWIGFANVRFLKDEKQTGQVNFDPNQDKFTTNNWGSEIHSNRLDVSTKVGYVWKDMPFQSIGLQNAFSSQEQDSYFGFRTYYIQQKSWYSNLIFNSIIDNTQHKFSTGLNFTNDNYQEVVFGKDWSRKDVSLGVFWEYTYDNADNFTIILGGRMDYHNRLGFFVTPRLHGKYNPWKDGVLRFSVGRGKRSANIFAENQNLFASSRVFNFLDNSGKIYGLNPEIAWNYGVGFLQKFKVFEMSSDVSFDFYRTDFQNQVVVDWMRSAATVDFYNLKGSSYANSVQLEWNIEFIKHLNFRSAYKFMDSKTDYNSGTYQRPLQPKHRFFSNVEYATHIKEKGKQWKFDFTMQWTGNQQLPKTAMMLPAQSLPEISPSYILMNSQITRTFSSVFEVYLGVENLSNYTQQNPIISASNPFSSSFESGIVYAPIFGKMWYTGLRFKVK